MASPNQSIESEAWAAGGNSCAPVARWPARGGKHPGHQGARGLGCRGGGASEAHDAGRLVPGSPAFIFTVHRSPLTVSSPGTHPLTPPTQSSLTHTTLSSTYPGVNFRRVAPTTSHVSHVHLCHGFLCRGVSTGMPHTSQPTASPMVSGLPQCTRPLPLASVPHRWQTSISVSLTQTAANFLFSLSQLLCVLTCWAVRARERRLLS